jgi:hypothetical protein
MTKVSNEILIKEAKQILKEKEVQLYTAVLWVFEKHRINDPRRFRIIMDRVKRLTHNNKGCSIRFEKVVASYAERLDIFG